MSLVPDITRFISHHPLRRVVRGAPATAVLFGVLAGVQDAHALPKCPVGKCEEVGEDVPAPSAIPKMALRITPGGHVEVSWAGLPVGRHELTRQRAIDWQCTTSESLPSPHSPLGTWQGATSGQHLDQTVVKGMRYCYRVTWQPGGGPGAELNECIDTGVDQPNGPPEIGDVGKRHIQVRWTDKYLQESRFVLQQRRGTSGWWKTVATREGQFSVSCQNFEATSAELDPDTRYCYRLKIEGRPGVTLHTPATCKSTRPLELASTPANLRVTKVTSDSYTIAWDYPNNGNELAGFIVENQSLTKASVGPDERSYTFTGLRPNVYYCARVQSVNGDGKSPRVTVCTTTLGSAPSVCSNGGPLGSFGPFCARCPGPVTKKVQTDAILACSKEQARALLEKHFSQCTVSDGGC